MKILGLKFNSALLLLIGLACGLSGVSNDAMAGESRSNGAKCYGNGGDTNFNYYANDGYKNTRIVSQGVFCPFVDDNSSVPRSTLSTLVVHGDRPSANNPVSVSACVKFWNASGIDCGLATSTSVDGQYAISPSLTKWTTRPGDFAFVMLDLSSLATVSGIFAKN